MKYTIFYLFLIAAILPIKAQDLIKPNVIIFYADDLGWQDTSLNKVGAPIPWETPNMEKLAAAGAKFSQAYSPAPTCAPSRAAMLSGRHPIKTKVTQVSGGAIPALKKAKAHNKLIGPFVPLRLAEEETTIAEALSSSGYVSAHVGKWHIAGANGFPEAIHQGFGSQETGRGMHQNMGDRWTGYATNAENDPYKIDADGRPFDSLTEDAVAFMEANKSEPFFLYMATWLVHTPIQTRDLALLTYYCNKLGIPVPTADTDITTGGQTNPYYGAMIGTLDWSLGKVIDYLEATDDPRNPGKKLFETTYIIFSSDNGASENDGNEIVADNFPLDLGKTSSKEGGIRVPLIITGPDIPVNQFSNVVNGLDFYPTILSLTGTTIDNALFNDLDGVDLSPLLKEENTIVENTNGNERTDLFWHYPNADDEKSKSAIRRGDYKLYKLYEDNSYEAFQLYNGGDNFVDIEESIDVINTMDQSIKADMIATLEAYLNNNNAKFPTWNPDYAEPDAPLVNQLNVPSVNSTNYDQDNQVISATISTELNQAAITTATLLYLESGDKEEWLESTLPVIINGNIITANVPVTATKVVFNMIDANNFLVLSDELTTVPGEIAVLGTIALSSSITPQLFNPATDFSELIGDTSVRGNDTYLQTRIVGGGAKFSVKVDDDLFSVVCDKVTFRVRSLKNDTVDFDVTIGGQTQSFNYISTRSADNVEFNFTGPISFTSALQDIEIVTTAISNSGNGVLPRFRIYDLTFHVSDSILLEDAPNQISLNGSQTDQLFNPAIDFSELIGGIAVRGGNTYLQTRAAGEGAKFSVIVDEALESVTTDRITFGIRSLKDDDVDFNITIGNQTQSFNYVSTRSADDVNFDFTGPITFTDLAQEIEIVTTSISNSGNGVLPRFRIYDLTFHVDSFTSSNATNLNSLSIPDAINNEDAQNQNIKMFPNPVKDVFSLTEEVDSGVIYSIHGAKTHEFRNKHSNIDISNLLPGLYILQINKVGSKKYFKLIKE